MFIWCKIVRNYITLTWSDSDSTRLAKPFPFFQNKYSRHTVACFSALSLRQVFYL